MFGLLNGMMAGVLKNNNEKKETIKNAIEKVRENPLMASQIAQSLQNLGIKKI